MVKCRIRGDFWPPHIEIGCQNEENRVYGLRMGADQPYLEPLTGVSLSLMKENRTEENVNGISFDLVNYDRLSWFKKGASVTNGFKASLMTDSDSTIVRGLAVDVGFSVLKLVQGMQIALGFADADQIQGCQFSFACTANEIQGAQICFGANAKHVHGIQIFILGGAEFSADAQVGIVRVSGTRDEPSLKISLASMDGKTGIPRPTMFAAFLVFNPALATVGIALDSLLPIDTWFSNMIELAQDSL